MSVDLGTYGGRRATLGYNGMLADLQSNDGVVNLINEGITSVDYGVAVADGVGVQSCYLAAAGTDRIRGISVRHVSAIGNVPGVVDYPRFSCVPVLEEGRILVTPYEAVTKGAPVFYRFSDGRLGITDDEGATTAPILGAVWEEAGDSAGVVPVSVNRVPA